MSFCIFLLTLSFSLWGILKSNSVTYVWKHNELSRHWTLYMISVRFPPLSLQKLFLLWTIVEKTLQGIIAQCNVECTKGFMSSWKTFIYGKTDRNKIRFPDLCEKYVTYSSCCTLNDLLDSLFKILARNACMASEMFTVTVCTNYFIYLWLSWILLTRIKNSTC